MIINSYTYRIGTGLGEYPAGTQLTDSIIGLVGLDGIKGLAYSNQYYNKDFDTEGNTLVYGNAFTSANGESLTVDFKHPLTIDTND